MRRVPSQGRLALIVVPLLLAACQAAPTTQLPPSAPPVSVNAVEPHIQPAAAEPVIQTGTATWYGKRHQGKRTADGERFDRHALTAAHSSLPFGSMVKVTNLANGRSIVVRVNDRTPVSQNHVIDLTEAAARELGFARDGRTEVALAPCADCGQ